MIAPSLCWQVTVAVQYAMSTHSLLFKVVANSFMERGADIAFLSAFPGEKEYVYPPLTYLEPTGEKQTLRVDDATFTVIDVTAAWPS